MSLGLLILNKITGIAAVAAAFIGESVKRQPKKADGAKTEDSMERIFLSGIMIENVRHLRNIMINISDEKPMHLILTGKNGSGKTSVLEAMSSYFNYIITANDFEGVPVGAVVWKEEFDDDDKVVDGIILKLHQSHKVLEEMSKKGQFIIAYYKDKRTFQAELPEHVEKVKLKDRYKISENPGRLFIKYLLDMKVTEALARNNGNSKKADRIKAWFSNFERLLQRIFEDPSLKLIFEEDTFSFLIQEKNRELFDFYSLSSGFAAILDIVLDLMLRMEAHNHKSFDFSMSGIVLIDEIETHLHIDLQRSILDLLTTLFPNIQYIITTHSPYILNAVEDCVIYDLEKNIRMENLSGYPAEGIVEGYFESESYSKLLLGKVHRYKVLADLEQPTEEERMERANLRIELKQISGNLAREVRDAFEDIERSRKNYGKI